MTGLDEYCTKIFVALFLQEQMHFNELYKFFVHGRTEEMSKPTLNNHLKHLIEAKYVIRTPKEGSQYVTYSLNNEKFGKLIEASDELKRMTEFERKSKESFFSLPENEQIDEALVFHFLRKLKEIQNRIEYELDPESLDKQIAVRLCIHPITDFVSSWIIEKSVKDEVYKGRILKAINDYLEKYS